MASGPEALQRKIVVSGIKKYRRGCIAHKEFIAPFSFSPSFIAKVVYGPMFRTAGKRMGMSSFCAVTLLDVLCSNR
jgi:hypothetical protein